MVSAGAILAVCTDRVRDDFLSPDNAVCCTGPTIVGTGVAEPTKEDVDKEGLSGSVRGSTYPVNARLLVSTAAEVLAVDSVSKNLMNTCDSDADAWIK